MRSLYSITVLMLLSAGTVSAGVVLAADASALAAAKGCLACHDVSSRKLGPAFKDVAERYSKEDGDVLVKRVLEGGSGSWGNVPMPASGSVGVTEADAKRLVNWIMSLK